MPAPASIRIGRVRDPIHGYITFTVPSKSKEITEKRLIDSEWVQRLRRIFQLQSAWVVYPCAVHTRFAHVLGAMQLAGDLALRLYPKFKEAFPNEEIPDNPYYVEEMFRLAGLLHDVGHGPLGHRLDEAYTYPRYKKTHEDISQRIVEEYLAESISKIRCSPHGRFDQPIDPKKLYRFIKLGGSFEGYALWEQVFSKIMLGIASADAMDFLLRDRYFCGTTDIGEIDLGRILSEITVSPHAGISLYGGALPALRGLLQTRYSLFRNIYYHPKKIAYDMVLGELLAEALEILRVGDIVKNLDRFLSITDFQILSVVDEWKTAREKRKRRIGNLWHKIVYARENPYHLLKEDERLYHTLREAEEMVPSHILEKEIAKPFPASAGAKGSIMRVDLRNQHLFRCYPDLGTMRKRDDVKSMGLIDGDDRDVSEWGNHSLGDIPLKYEAARVYGIGEAVVPLVERDAFAPAPQLGFGFETGYAAEAARRTEITST